MRNTITLALSLSLLHLCHAQFCSAEQEDDITNQKNNNGTVVVYEEDESEHSALHTAIFYLPNRILDVFDIFRLRIRVGPGVSAGARATKIAQVYAGSYASIYAGLPGPRLSRLPKLPIGLESHSGATISAVDVTVDGGIGPDYSDSEIGAGFQAGIIGLDFGIDPVEIAELFAGIFTFDLREDDF
jgi:hypothetical protein